MEIVLPTYDIYDETVILMSETEQGKFSFLIID